MKMVSAMVLVMGLMASVVSGVQVPTAVVPTAGAHDVTAPRLEVGTRSEGSALIVQRNDAGAGYVALTYGWRFVTAERFGSTAGFAQAQGFAVAFRGAGVRSVQIDTVTLGSSSRALAGSQRPVNSGQRTTITSSTRFIELPHGVPGPDFSCSDDYRVRVTVSVRWADGSLGRYSRLSALESDCRGEL